MTQIQQVGPNHWQGPEDWGYTPNFYITQHGADHYPNGHLIQQEPLQPNNKRVVFDAKSIESAEDLGELFEMYSAGGHEGYLDMRVQSVHGRGEVMGVIFLLLLIWLGSKTLSLFYGVSWSDTYQLDLVAFGIIALIILFGLFKPIAMPVRFHKGNQEVYVWHHRVLYRIPWDECEMSVIVAKTHMGHGRLKDGYELMLWLNPKHAVNQALTGESHRYISLLHNMGSHVPVYGYWEYVRRYMTSETPLWMELSDRPRVARVSREGIKSKGYLIALIEFILVLPIFFIFRPADFTLWCNPLRAKWPDDVHEWTGEKCNWH